MPCVQLLVVAAKLPPKPKILNLDVRSKPWRREWGSASARYSDVPSSSLLCCLQMEDVSSTA